MSGNKKRPYVLWDTSVFLAWFNKEADKDLVRLTAVVDEVDAMKVIVCVSAISQAEILDTAKSLNAKALFSAFCKRSNVQQLLPDERIIGLASEIRQDALDGHQADKSRPKLKTPDAIIAASAIIYQVPRMFSYDPDLLNLSGSPVLRSLIAEKPTTITRSYSPPLFN